MNSAFPLSLRSAPQSGVRRLYTLTLVLAVSALSSTLFAQVDPNADPAAGGRNRRGQNGQNGAANPNGGGRGNFSPEEIQQRISTALREQFEVTDDAEWKLISDRITAVSDLRQAAGGFGGRGGGGNPFGGGGGGGAGGNRGGRGGNTEQLALRQAITDKLPEAEIKSRLDRLREVRKANEEKLLKAQEDLRAVLSVRQEAVAVMSGLLP
ncbi:MAG: hypothetical protein ABIZ81_15910 [Opitutaceae bacterium]